MSRAYNHSETTTTHCCLEVVGGLAMNALTPTELLMRLLNGRSHCLASNVH